MTTARQGRLTVAAIATALLFSTHLSAQTSQASQTEGAVGLTDEFVDVLVGVMSLADPLSPPPHLIFISSTTANMINTRLALAIAICCLPTYST